jgi:D-alanyl-D-alanine carboxypeptidase
MKNLLYGCVFGLLLPFFASAQTFNPSRLDSLLELLNRNQRWMGSVAVSQGGKPIYSRALGYKNVETSELADTGTVYAVGSITKMYTAVLVLKAVEEGTLSLEAKLDRFFPEIPKSAEITIAHMLGHRSGIASITSTRDFDEWKLQPVTREEMLDKTKQIPSLFEPGSQTRYSNSNYILLTYILEDISGTSYADLLAQEITRPLGLLRTYVPGIEALNTQESQAYKFLGVWEKIAQSDPSVTLGAGFLLSTPEELNRFIEGLFGGELVQPSSLSQMLQIQEKMGLGVHEFSFGDVQSFGHTGSKDGFISFVGFLPDQNLSISFSANGINYPHSKFTQQLYATILDPNATLPEFPQVSFGPGELDRFTGVYGAAEAPIKLTISVREGYLLAQASGQEPFVLEATDKTSFQFEQIGLAIDFHVEESALVLRQGGKDMKFVKE